MKNKIVPEKTEAGYRVGPKGSSFGRSMVLVNPAEREFVDHRYVLAFGAYGWTVLVVWADSLDDAVEVAAEWLAEHAPGHVMAEFGDEHKELLKEACEELGKDWATFDELPDEDKWEVCDLAEADLTRTESGFLTSHEWTVIAEDPSREEFVELLYSTGVKWTADDGLLTNDPV